MQTFKYEMRNKAGTKVSGVMHATSIAEATNLIREHGELLRLMPAKAGSLEILARMREVKIQFGPGLRDVFGFTKQLAVMIKAGISIRSALDGIANQIENLKFRAVVQQIKADVEAGRPFSKAIEKHPKVFSRVYVNMIRASELSGTMGHMLERIAGYLTKQIETRRMVRGAMIYPAIICFMAVGATIFLLTFALPRFMALFAGKDVLLPAPTRILIALSTFLRYYWYVVVVGGGALVLGLNYATRTPWGRPYWDRIKLRIPVFRRILRDLYITQSISTMGELVSAGAPMLETLLIIADVSTNTLYKRMWQTVHDDVRKGTKIAQSLTGQLLPASVVQMISAGEESGTLGKVLQDINEFYSEELKATIKAATTAIEPAMILLMGVIVGFIATSIILPIFKMSSLVR